MRNLHELDIDINSGLEYLPNGLEKMYFSSYIRKNTKVNEAFPVLYPYEESEYEYERIRFLESKELDSTERSLSIAFCSSW